MLKRLVRPLAITAVVCMLLVGGVAGIAGAAHDLKDSDADDRSASTVVFVGVDSVGDQFPDGTTIGETVVDAMKAVDKKIADGTASEEAFLRVKKAFLASKKAFHEERQEIQAIKKGTEDPRENVPSFFDSEDGDDEDDSGDEEFQDGSDPELST